MTNEEIKESLDYIATMACDIGDILKYDYEANPKSTEMEYCSKIESEAGKLIQALEVQRWILVSERLPEDDKIVIASTEYGVYPEASYSKEHGWEKVVYKYGVYCGRELDGVTAWMPLLEPYKPESEKKK